MTALKPLLDAECGVANPLVQLSQVYTHAPQNGSNDHDRPIIVPNTFHLQSLLTNLRQSDRAVHQWTQEFLSASSDHVPSKAVTNADLERIPWAYPLPSPFSVLHPNPPFLDQLDPGFDHDTVRATQNLLSFLRERELAVDTEDQPLAAQVIPYETKEEERQPEEINAFEEGLKCLEAHDIANAILLFQIAVRKQPNHTDAWLCLGITQTENEQDGPAIVALKKCIELDPKNSQAYLTLASCYANELKKAEAFDSLYQWLANNNRYSHLLSNRPSSSVMHNQLTFEDLRDLFFQAVSCSDISNMIDTDLQVCLGILFYLNEEYAKAAECFNTAVLAKPNDALLWNKLGASLGNGGEDTKAVYAYYHALTLSPGFVRARCNLGISCFNLKAYEQAVEHLLIALKLQTQGSMSENIWRTLASAIHCLKRSDLEQYVVCRNLRKLLCEFHIT